VDTVCRKFSWIFFRSPGQYWAVVQAPLSDPQSRLVDIGKGKDGVTAVDMLLR
jgi:hypothetical protein